MKNIKAPILLLAASMLACLNVTAQDGFTPQINIGVAVEHRSLKDLNRFRNDLASRKVDWPALDLTSYERILDYVHFTTLRQAELSVNPFKNRRFWLTGMYFRGETHIAPTTILQEANTSAGAIEIKSQFEEKLKWEAYRVGLDYQWADNIKGFSFRAGISYELSIYSEYNYIHYACTRLAGSNDEFVCRPPNPKAGDVVNQSISFKTLSPVTIFSQRCSYALTHNLSLEGCLYLRWGSFQDFSDVSGFGASISAAYRFARKPNIN